MPEFLLLEEQNHKQDAWEERRDEQGRKTRPQRPARDEKALTVRLDRQFTAKLRVARGRATGRRRQDNIAKEVARVMLGEEIAPGIQVVEYEVRLTEALEAMVQDEVKDEAGTVVQEATYTPPTEERLDHVFALRLKGLDLAKAELTDDEFNQRDWTMVLAGKVEMPEAWVK